MDTLLILRDTIATNVVKVIDCCSHCVQETETNWADVEIESGVTLKKTDDLLDYIKGNNSSIIGRIDNVELANAGYEVRCEKSVCYVGDVLKSGSLNYIPLYIYKNGTLLSGWSQISAEGITLKTPYTKPTSGNDIITFSNTG